MGADKINSAGSQKNVDNIKNENRLSEEEKAKNDRSRFASGHFFSSLSRFDKYCSRIVSTILERVRFSASA